MSRRPEMLGKEDQSTHRSTSSDSLPISISFSLASSYNEFTDFKELTSLPGFFAVESKADGGRGVLISRHAYRDQIVIRSYGAEYSRPVSLGECFDRHRMDYNLHYAGSPYQNVKHFEEPLVVWRAEEIRSECFRIVILAEDLILAYSDFFVAAFSPRFGCWFLNCVAVDAGRYFILDPPHDLRYRVELNWFGRGVENLTIVKIDELGPWYRAPLDFTKPLFPPRPIGEFPDTVLKLEIDGKKKIHIETAEGRYQLIPSLDGPTFKIVQFDGNLDPLGLRMEVDRISHRLLPAERVRRSLI